MAPSLDRTPLTSTAKSGAWAFSALFLYVPTLACCFKALHVCHIELQLCWPASHECNDSALWVLT